MKSDKKRHQQKLRRAHRTRHKISGTPETPRLTVNRSLKHISVQIIDDTVGKTLVSADDRDLKGNKQEVASEVGKRIAEVAKAKGIESVVFDRGSFRYHGRIKLLADGARAGGLNF